MYDKNDKRPYHMFHLALGLAVMAITGCEISPLPIGLTSDYETDCSYCHGSENNDAPPEDLDASSDIRDISVGAHQAHLQDEKIAKAVPCEECHIVPELSDDPNHLPEDEDDDHAEVVFGELAGSGGVDPTWNREDGTCLNTYCHGATLDGGKHTEPLWTVVDGTQSDCDSCHSNPPPPPHTTGTNCGLCHPGTVDDQGEIIVSGGLHINGVVDSEDACSACHGSGDEGAPPPALDGSTDTTHIGVGAHETHMSGGQFTLGVECSECHVVPASPDDPGHNDSDLPAEVTFGPLASTEMSQPDWNREFTPPTCTNVYCHGASLPGGATPEPIWTQVDGEQIYCGSCHSIPPPLPHQEVTQCEFCHPQTVISDQTINLSSGTHIDGEVTMF